MVISKSLFRSSSSSISSSTSRASSASRVLTLSVICVTLVQFSWLLNQTPKLDRLQAEFKQALLSKDSFQQRHIKALRPNVHEDPYDNNNIDHSLHRNVTADDETQLKGVKEPTDSISESGSNDKSSSEATPSESSSPDALIPVPNSFLSHEVHEQHGRPPVVIVPGALASMLEAKLHKNHTVSMMCSKNTGDDWYTLWITESALVASKCFFDNVKLRYKGQGKAADADGVETRVPFYGDSVQGIRCMLSYTKKLCTQTKNWLMMIDKLEASGYQVGKDLFSAPYDFRRGPDDYMDDAFPKLKALVEQAYESNNGNKRVALMSISMGSMFVHTFLTHFVTQEWKDKYIHRWLSMSGTFNGFGQAFHNVVFGRKQFLGFSFAQTDIRDAYRTWPSSLWLVPKPIYGDDRVILRTPGRDYKLSEIGDVLHGDQASMYTRSFRYNMTADPGVATDCWFGEGTPTAKAYQIEHNMSRAVFDSETPIEVKELKGNGDDAADMESLRICQTWKSATVRQFAGRMCHSCFLQRDFPINAGIELLLGNVSAKMA